MNFISTAQKAPPSTLADAIRSGLAQDGGLFVPETFPSIDLNSFTPDLSFPRFAHKVLEPFFVGDILETQVAEFCDRAFNFPLPLKPVNANTFILELFHGPTLSFKDFGARFLAEALNFLSDTQKTTIMVATSGDTGSAVAASIHLKPNLQLIILYPEGKISARQEHQMTCWDDNVHALAVKGNFDDCQTLVKKAFQDREWNQRLRLSSANSINIGRLLPQISYYASTSFEFYRQTGEAPGFIIPTGNLGNATAAYWAKMLGFPIREIVLSTNANVVLPDFLQTGEFRPRPSLTTLANAMDVGNPSNFERLQNLFPNFSTFKQEVSALSANDEDIRKTIQTFYQEYRILICPHTATACFARQSLSEKPWIVVATADPCKFNDMIEPLLKVKVPLAESLQVMLEKPIQRISVEANLNAIKQLLKKRGII